MYVETGLKLLSSLYCLRASTRLRITVSMEGRYAAYFDAQQTLDRFQRILGTLWPHVQVLDNSRYELTVHVNEYPSIDVHGGGGSVEGW
jgi:hypothetical protein